MMRYGNKKKRYDGPAGGINSRKPGIRALRFDILFFLAVVFISCLGVLVIYSATRNSMPGGVGDPAYYLKRQSIFLGSGMALFAGFQFVNYRKIRDLWWIAAGLGILSLIAVLLFGYEVHGSKSWIDLGLAPACLAAAIFIMLVLLEPDFGTAIIYLSIFVGMLFVSGANFFYVLAIMAAAAGGFFGALKMGIIKQYQLDRILIFLRPDVSTAGAGYNLHQSKMAIGSGGLTGKGLFLGTQTNLSYVPEHHTDFIFSVIGEELGFLGGFIVIALLGFIIWRCFATASRANNSFGMLAASGVGFMILTQVVINIGMTIGIMPIIGIPLPFLSSGGSSLLSTMLGAALVSTVNIYRDTRKDHEIAYEYFSEPI